MAVTTVKAEMGGTVIDCLVYGLYISVFVRATQVLFRRQKYGTTSIALICTTLSLFCIITVHLALDVDRAFRAFTDHTDTPNYAKGYYNVLSGAEALAKNSAYVTITLIADAFLIFRCWAAFGRNVPMVLIPSGLYIGNLATACWALVTFKKAEDPTTGEVVVAEVISRVKYMYITTLCLNLYCSLSIATRIWLVQRQSTAGSGRLLTNTLTIVVESAALYSVLLIILITSAALENPLMYAVLNPVRFSLLKILFRLVYLKDSDDIFLSFLLDLFIQMPSVIGFVVSNSFPWPKHALDDFNQFSSIIIRIGTGRAFSTRKTVAHSGEDAGAHSTFIESIRFGRPAGEQTLTTIFSIDNSLYTAAYDRGVGGGSGASGVGELSVHFPSRQGDGSHGSAEATGRSSSGGGSDNILEGVRREEKDNRDMV
ncbi:hypothetical protein GYMLUDRAFT_52677 [Collybiopsis luxurians FD-317 M1]|nr:hypothetical protein GYMLUDRAFT_52677 [Collybiopsis luxurians FD-317 M1]